MLPTVRCALPSGDWNMDLLEVVAFVLSPRVDMSPSSVLVGRRVDSANLWTMCRFSSLQWPANCSTSVTAPGLQSLTNTTTSFRNS
eukprot:3542333-Prymnesium_polylepis.1